MSVFHFGFSLCSFPKLLSQSRAYGSGVINPTTSDPSITFSFSASSQSPSTKSALGSALSSLMAMHAPQQAGQPNPLSNSIDDDGTLFSDTRTASSHRVVIDQRTGKQVWI